MKELRLEGVSLNENSYKLLLSPHLQLHSLELNNYKSEMLYKLHQLLYKSQNLLRNFALSLLNSNIEYVYEVLLGKEMNYIAIGKEMNYGPVTDRR